jgi:FAD/FMN-containing dehydrogenase
MTVEATSTLSVHMPGTPGYREATAVYNLFAPVQPDEAVIADSAGSVAAAITRARSRGLDVEVISTGHASSMADQMSGALLVRTVPSGPVEIDPQTHRARIPAGTRWGAVAEAAAQYGLGAMHGSSPDVGAVGYLLRGGLSFYGRRFGLAANSLRAVELVAADGQLHRVDTDHDPSLFWAVRGGGGGFGVCAVTWRRRVPRWPHGTPAASSRTSSRTATTRDDGWTRSVRPSSTSCAEGSTLAGCSVEASGHRVSPSHLTWSHL